MDTSPIIWRIDLFGRLRAFWNDQTIERFPTQKTGTLLALLAFSSHRRHSREELAGILWPDADSAAARDRLSQALVWLRPRLEPEGIVRGSVLETDRLSIGFHSGTVTTDVAEFETALNTARRATDSSTRKKHWSRPLPCIKVTCSRIITVTGFLLNDSVSRAPS